jgi:hypothetical protein
MSTKDSKVVLVAQKDNHLFLDGLACDGSLLVCNVKACLSTKVQGECYHYWRLQNVLCRVIRLLRRTWRWSLMSELIFVFVL